jgi:hypothetical protein
LIISIDIITLKYFRDIDVIGLLAAWLQTQEHIFFLK